jgi:hypothetical protein
MYGYLSSVASAENMTYGTYLIDLGREVALLDKDMATKTRRLHAARLDAQQQQRVQWDFEIEFGAI